jgi:hypothetical protein
MSDKSSGRRVRRVRRRVRLSSSSASPSSSLSSASNSASSSSPPPRPRPRPHPPRRPWLPPPHSSPPPRSCFASLTRPFCRLGPLGPRSPIQRLVVLQERRPRGRLTTRLRIRPRPRHLSARRFPPRRRFGRLLMHARRLVHIAAANTAGTECAAGVSPLVGRCSTRRLGRSPCAERNRWAKRGEEAGEIGT